MTMRHLLLIYGGAALAAGAAAFAGANWDSIFGPSPVRQLERQYELVRLHGKPTERCGYAQVIAEEYLRQENEGQYRDWQNEAEIACAIVGIDRFLARQ